LAFRIPACRKQGRGQGKRLLRSLARRRLPAGLWRLPKRGFTAPMREWIAGPDARRFREEVLRPGAAIHGLLDVQELDRRFTAHSSGVADHSHTLWATWVLERWLQDA